MHLAPEAVVVAVDPVRLEQVVPNLVDNAVKYTPDDGHLDVTVHANAHEAVIMVEDDGDGIPTERANSIFEPFVQLCESRYEARGGLGLGLPLVRRLTELHGGRVELARSENGCGSRFVVHLPLPPAMAIAVRP